MDTSILKYRAFVEAADAGSIAAAAERMGYSISSVSRMIADLEAGCRVRLFARGKAGVTPTADGQRLLARARRIITECDGFDDEAASILGLERGRVRIGTISSIATHVLPLAMASFRQSHPAIEFELLLGDYVEIAAWLASGRVDLGTLRSPVPGAFRSRTLVRDRLVAIVPPAHPLAGADAFPLSAFAHEPFLALERGGLSEVASLFDGMTQPIRPAFSTWDDHAIMAMVEAGMGLAVLPELITKRCAYEIAIVPLEVAAPRDIAIAWQGDDSLSSATAAFLETLAVSQDMRDVS